ncbi:MAG TPA: LuxR C-terminal-related transcriptional regulator, partial [Aggregatilineales bacterium]|nr:LuxR C-terminal-related transcriptional regulator [Aggregatilineales bacterium]
LRLLPELQNDYSDIPLPSGDSEQEKRRLHQALTRFFSSLSAAQSLLVIIEDVHWCDDASLEFLLLLARRMSSLRVLILLTFRDDEISEALAGFLAQLDRERLTTEFRLSHLPVETVGRMVRAIFAMERNPRSEFVDAVHNLSEGNPFFIEEMLKSMVAAGDIFLSDGKWEPKPLDEIHIPRTVQVSLHGRLNHLSSAAHEILTIAAAAGKRFDFVLLQHLTGMSEVELLQVIHELKDAGFVVEESPDTFAFRHALTRQAVYQEMFTRERSALHQAIGEAYEQLHPGSVDDLATHFFAAEIPEKALDYAAQAAERAQSLYAPRAAARYLTIALEAAQQLGKRRPDLYRGRGQTYEQIGDFEAAQADYLTVRKLAQESGDLKMECQALLDVGFLWTGQNFQRAGEYLQEAIALARQLNDPAVLASSLNRVGNWYANREQPFEGLRCHREALTLFEALDDAPGIAATLDLLAVTSLMAGNMLDCGQYYQQAALRLRQLENPQMLSSCLATMSLVGVSYMTDTSLCPNIELRESINHFNEALHIAHQMGWQSGEAGAYMYGGLGFGARGAFELALEAGNKALEIASEIEHRLWIAGAHMLLGRLYLDLLALPQAQTHLEQALEQAKDINTAFMVNANSAFLALTYIEQGKLDQAEAILDDVLQPDMLAGEQLTQVQRLVVCATAELAIVRGDAQRALEIIEGLILSDPNAAEHKSVIPRLWYLRGLALTELNESDAALENLQVAQEAAEGQGSRSLLWQIYLSAGKLDMMRGRREQAEMAFDAVRYLIETLAAQLSDRSLREHFLAHANRKIPQKPPLSPRQAAQLMYDGLTERECEVAVLIASGKTSREIAEQLVLSKRTVDAHTASILSKLGFSSRIQIARWAVEKGLI